jgi:quinol monooxygenase YgiN
MNFFRPIIMTAGVAWLIACFHPGIAQTVEARDPQTNIPMTNAVKYGLTGKLKALPGKRAELEAILLQAAEMVSKARGCHVYLVCRDPGATDVIWMMEAWDSKEDHDNSLMPPEVKALITRAIPLIDGKPEGTVLEIIGGVGI